MRIAPNELSFTDPTAWDDIYSNREGSNPFSFRKSEHSCWHGNSEGGAASVFVTINSKEHSRIRRFIDPAFSERAVLQQEPILQEYVDLFLSKIHEQCSARSKTTVNIVDWLNFTLFDTIGELVFGESFRCLEKREYEGWMAQMAATIKLQYLSTNLRHYPLLNNLLRPIARFLTPKDITAQQRDHRQRSEAKLKRRLSPTYKPDGADIVSKLVRSDDREQGLTYDEVTLNSILFINAASETTATVLTGVINNLLEQPESLFKLQTELQRFSMLDDLTLQSLKSLPYLNAVLKEGLRMCNPK